MSSSYIKEKLTPYPAVRQPKDEIERQKFRAERVISTRFLDNNYNSNMYKTEYWKPNGIFIVKKRYEACDSGLTYFFEKEGVISKKDLTENKENPYYHSHQKGGKLMKSYEKKEIQVNPVIYPEYSTMRNSNERIVTIEFCSNCEDHSMHTDHSSQSYLNAAKNLYKAIKIRFPAIKVILKPIDTSILKDFKQSFQDIKKSKNINDKFKPVRIGAFEVQIALGEDADKVKVIHSKLNSQLWPSISYILKSISKYVPQIYFSIRLFEQDEEEGEGERNEKKGKNKESNDENEKASSLIELKSTSKLKNIEVRIRFIKFPEIENIIEAYKNDLDLIINPKGRISTLSTIEYMKKVNIELNPIPFTSSFYNSYNDLQKKNEKSKVSKNRIWSSRIHDESASLNMNSLQNNSLIYNYNNYSHYLGEVLENHFTDENGQVKISGCLPYDSYLIEVIDNKFFSGMCFIFRPTILEEGNPVIRKSLLLKPQVKSYLSVLVNTQNENNEYVYISKSKVYINRLASHSSDISIDHIDHIDNDNRIEILESKEGNHSIQLVPGKYLLEIRKEGFEYFQKEIIIESGENNISAELIKRRRMNFKITCISFGIDDLTYVKNVYVKLVYSSTQELIDGVTNKEGTIKFENLKEDEFYSIHTSCEGYFDNTRDFITKPVREFQKGDFEIVVLLVKKDLIRSSKAMIIVHSSNFPFEDGVEHDFEFSQKMKDLVRIDKISLSLQGNIGYLLRFGRSIKIYLYLYVSFF